MLVNSCVGVASPKLSSSALAEGRRSVVITASPSFKDTFQFVAVIWLYSNMDGLVPVLRNPVRVFLIVL